MTQTISDFGQGKKYIYSLTFDEMHIHALDSKSWDPNCRKWSGVVDTGGELEDLNPDGQHKMAKKVLVFTLVSLNSNFKCPVTYFFVDLLKGDEKFTPLQSVLISLNEKNLCVKSLTFDGDNTQDKACVSLRANFNIHSPSSRPYILHLVTKEIIYVFLDPCHMIKLIRLMLDFT